MKHTDDIEEYARAYVGSALKALGSPEISTEDHDNAVTRAATAFEELAQVRQRSSDQEPMASN